MNVDESLNGYDTCNFVINLLALSFLAPAPVSSLFFGVASTSRLYFLTWVVALINGVTQGSGSGLSSTCCSTQGETVADT